MRRDWIFRQAKGWLFLFGKEQIQDLTNQFHTTKKELSNSKHIFAAQFYQKNHYTRRGTIRREGAGRKQRLPTMTMDKWKPMTSQQAYHFRAKLTVEIGLKLSFSIGQSQAAPFHPGWTWPCDLLQPTEYQHMRYMQRHNWVCVASLAILCLSSPWYFWTLVGADPSLFHSKQSDPARAPISSSVTPPSL